MAMVDVDGSSHLSADSQPKLVGLVSGLAATRRSVCIHQMNRVNSCSDHGQEDSTVNIVVELLLFTIIIKQENLAPCGTDGQLLLSGFQLLVALTLTLDRVIRHTVVHHSSTSIYVPDFTEIGQTFCGRMCGWTYRRTY